MLYRCPSLLKVSSKSSKTSFPFWEIPNIPEYPSHPSAICQAINLTKSGSSGFPSQTSFAGTQT